MASIRNCCGQRPRQKNWDNEVANLAKFETWCTEKSVQGWEEGGATPGKAKSNLGKRRRDSIVPVRGVRDMGNGTTPVSELTWLCAQ